MPEGHENQSEARLVIRSGHKAGSVIPLSRDRARVIGRDPGVDLQILDELMSRAHSRIEHAGDTWYLVDLDSSNGTFVNGKRIERATLKTGDSILLGKTRFEFLAAGDAELYSGKGSGIVELVDDEPGQGASTSVVKRVELHDLRRGGSDAAARAADRALETIYEVGNLINAESDLGRLLEAIVDSVCATFKVERAVLFLVEESELVVRVSRVQGRPTTGSTGRVSRTVVQRCRDERVAILSSDAMKDDRFKSGDSILLERIRSIMCVPLDGRKGVLGVLYLDNRGIGGAYQERDLELLAAIGKQAGIAIERAMLHEHTKQRLAGALRMLVALVECAVPDSDGHSERVSGYAVQIARALEQDEDSVEHVRLAALLHDISRTLLPPGLLEKRGDLTAAEDALLRQHPIASARVAASIHGPGSIADAVRAHHECFDGTGYPLGLAGEDIPLHARIIALANGWDDLTKGRAGQPTATDEDAIAVIRGEAGKKYDPALVETLARLHESGRLLREMSSFSAEELLQ